MTELEIIKAAKEALLMCASSIEPRSPAGKELKRVLELINEYLKEKPSKGQVIPMTSTDGRQTEDFSGD